MTLVECLARLPAESSIPKLDEPSDEVAEQLTRETVATRLQSVCHAPVIRYLNEVSRRKDFDAVERLARNMQVSGCLLPITRLAMAFVLCLMGHTLEGIRMARAVISVATPRDWGDDGFKNYLKEVMECGMKSRESKVATEVHEFLLEIVKAKEAATT